METRVNGRAITDYKKFKVLETGLAIPEVEPVYLPAVLNGQEPNDFIVDSSLVFYLPLHSLYGSKFKSVDRYKYTCEVTGALWRPYGREFDGYDDNILLPDISAPFSTEATLMMWLKIDTDPPTHLSRTGLFYLGTPTTSCHYPLDSNGLIYLDAFRTARVNAIDDGTFDKTVWHLLTITTEPGTDNWKFYQNLTEVTSTTGEDTVSLPSAPKFGQSQSISYNLDGSIGEIFIYNRVLSLAEITHNYNVTKWRYL